MQQTKDMTRGNPARLILWFSLPIIFANGLQQFYSLVDSLVIGRIEGVIALTAVSASGWLDWTILSIAMGLSQGFSIQIAQSFGAGKTEDLKRAVGQSILLSIMVVLCLEVVSQLLLYPMLRLLNTPDEIIHLTALYLRIIFGGLPIVMGVNLLSGFLRSLGDSRTPLIATIAATFTNLVLDLLFVGVLHWGVAGVAAATTTAQFSSFLICLLAFRKIPVLHIEHRHVTPDPVMMRRLMFLGTPIAFQSLVISIGGLILQRVVNGFDFIFIAGYNAASRLQGPIEMAGASLGGATGTFAGQNYGANRLDRVKQGLRDSVIIAMIIAAIICGFTLAFGRNILSLFVTDDPALVDQVLRYGYNFLKVMAIGLFGLYILLVYRSTLQGLGDTIIPMRSGIIELIMRISAALLLPQFLGEWGVYSAEILAWWGAAIFLVVGYYRRIREIESGKWQGQVET